MAATFPDSTSVGSRSEQPAGDALVSSLLALRDEARSLEAAWREAIEVVPDADRASARNLVHYLALRRHDIRDVQRALAARGLSSLGRAEGHVIATIDAVLGHLGSTPPDDGADCPSFESSRELLANHTQAALGPLRPSARVRLMVTLPSQAATNPALVAGLIESGMGIARINCAHDDAEAWQAMAAAVRTEAARAGREVRIAFDLAGPKLRTGPLPPGPQVVRLKPRRGADGAVLRPATARLVTDPDDPAGGGNDPTGTVRVPVGADLVAGAAVGDKIKLRDARDRRRRLVVVAADGHGIDVSSERTTYLATGTELSRHRDGRFVARGTVGELPAAESFLHVERGETVRIRRGGEPGRQAAVSTDGVVVEPATIGCELDAVFDAIAIGDRVLVDDGTIEAVVDAAGDGWFDVVVTRPDSAKLKAEKGINLPDTDFVAPALTSADLTDLDSVAPIADLVSLSFVQSPQDLTDLRTALAERGHPDVAIGLKIEHATAFAALPQLLLAGLQGPPIAVMLARGDLAIEVGFERLAELQEEVLWLCEAAHVPVIWATQVAESMAKQGLPTRAEVTDAAWASRAECVMLNKGPHILDTIRFLDDIFDRMHEHQDKRTPLLRRLSVSDAFSLHGSDGTPAER